MRKKVAVIVTEYRYNSHADMILGRLLGDHGYEPRVDVAAVYTDQVPDNDMSREMCGKAGVPIVDSIDAAVAYGAPDRPIDGIVVIGEHGQYPWNEKQQHLYPRRRFMEQVLAAMDRLGLRVPIFLDKHYSFDNRDAIWLYEQIRVRGLPFLAGSSVPFTKTVPAYDPAWLRAPEAIYAVCGGGYEAYGYHATEVLQSLAEQRGDGESGVASVRALAGEAMWTALDRGEWPEDLLLTAIAAAKMGDGRHPREACEKPVLFEYGYRDGLVGYVAVLPQYFKSWTYAIRKRSGEVLAAQCLGGKERPYHHFTTFTRYIEDMILDGRLPCPMERTYLTTLMINTAMESLHRKIRLAPPELGVIYGRGEIDYGLA